MSAVGDQPRLTLFAGPNGSGKSTAYDCFLAAGYESGPYLNPDDVERPVRTRAARGHGTTMHAGREVIERSRALMASRRSFVRETTLSGQEAGRSVFAAKALGYRVVLVFVAVSSKGLLAWRIGVRVGAGGHDIPVQDQARRFRRSFANAPSVARVADAARYGWFAEGLHAGVAERGVDRVAVGGGVVKRPSSPRAKNPLR